MVDTGQCASEDTKPRRRADGKIPHRLERKTSVSKDARFQGVNCEIPRRLEKEIKHSKYVKKTQKQ